MQPVADTFTRVADGYDRLNRILSLGLDVLWRRRALALLAKGLAEGGLASPDILDIATGTADFAIAAARIFPDAMVTGLDLTPAMLEIGARKVAAAGLARRIVLMTGDATALPIADGSFGTALCAFGFRNFPDIPASLSEAARILRDGGQLVVLEFFRPRTALLGALTSGWLKAVSTLFARGRAADYAYLRASIAKTCSAVEFAAMAREAGLALAGEKFFFPACTCLVLRKCGKIRNRLGTR
ncbi:MAG: ubiquinone/menaquinone biosynthesis methyltransferase [Kiritimatiellae bacterium]|nr:ubiquinone/menaquinone biosynthesis methyltransferase [Kiritimatiellia bacterium]